MQLSERLKCVADMVTPGLKMADIGTDHGFVPIYLVKNGISPYAFAMDYREGPLLRAQNHIKEEGLSEKIETRRSDGFEKLRRGEADTAVIAGMGGPLIADILKAGSDTVEGMESVILSPQSRIDDVRRFIIQSGYHIEREKCVFEGGKYYFVIKMIPRGKDDSHWEKEDFQFGKFLIEQNDAVLKQFLIKEKKIYEKLLAGQAGDNVKEKFEMIDRALERMKERGSREII